MMSRHSITPSLQPEPVLRWIFQRDSQAITCELDVRPNRLYEVCVVPHWDVESAIVEQFDGPTAAMLRHAEIARALRESKWVLTDHLPAGDAPLAA
jgi:hypothetical protein